MFAHLPTKNYTMNGRMHAYLNKRFWKAVCEDCLAKSVGRKKINTLFTSLGRSVYGKTVPSVSSTALDLRPWAVLETSGTVFPHTDLPSDE